VNIDNDIGKSNACFPHLMPILRKSGAVSPSIRQFFT